MSGTIFDYGETVGAWTPLPRPPYRVPGMAEVRAAEGRTGMIAVDSFSGCGGSSIGLRLAGFDVRYAIEFIPAAADTYEANSSAYVDRRDVRDVKGAEILERLGRGVGELDLFGGSPPCSSWSSAGTGHRTRERTCDVCGGTGYRPATFAALAEPCETCDATGTIAGIAKAYSDGAKQRTDDLFEEYVRLVDEMRPRAFVAENVPGLLGSDAVGYVNAVTAGLSDLGYHVTARVLNAMHYGAATSRERLIFLGIRRDLDVMPSFPDPTVAVPYTVGDALAIVREDHPEDVEASSMEPFAVGRTWRVLRDAAVRGEDPDESVVACERCGLFPDAHRREEGPGFSRAWCADGERAKLTKLYFLAVLAHEDAPCPTITATGAQTGAASVMMPTECRKFTPREAATISGFPYDFTLTGDRQRRYERIGRAVPPPLYEAVGAHLAKLLGKAGI